MYFDDVGTENSGYLDVVCDEALFRRLIPFEEAHSQCRLMLGQWHTSKNMCSVLITIFSGYGIFKLAASLGVRYFEKLEKLVELPATCRVLELICVAVACALTTYAQSLGLALSDLEHTSDYVIKVCSKSGDGGDGGIDIIGMYKKIPIIIQCKKHRRSIVPGVVRELEGVLGNLPKCAIGILVAPKFSEGAVSQVSSSEFNILLTNEADIVSDLINFIETRQIISKLELTLEKLLGLIGLQQKDVEEISKRLEVLEIEIRKSLENLEVQLKIQQLNMEESFSFVLDKFVEFSFVIDKLFFYPFQVPKLFQINLSTNTDMPSPKAWYKLMNPESAWDKVSLEEVNDVADLKKAVKKEAAPKLDAFAASDLTIKVLKDCKNGSRAIEVHPQKTLAAIIRALEDPAAVLAHLEIESPLAQKHFAENIWVFVYAPSEPMPVAKKAHIDMTFTSVLAGKTLILRHQHDLPKFSHNFYDH
ncbi:8831_t:CDS:2 [Paraglomus occultum]|uniref:8831_t:CDS:1 n=1 Tax=Paraglomus occultum TaxID=144539 RepID=A0A9N9BEQ1_9GLOM|nr:8831_t:CDS:2 [Paraglomus occultum]